MQGEMGASSRVLSGSNLKLSTKEKSGKEVSLNDNMFYQTNTLLNSQPNKNPNPTLTSAKFIKAARMIKQGRNNHDFEIQQVP